VGLGGSREGDEGCCLGVGTNMEGLGGVLDACWAVLGRLGGLLGLSLGALGAS